MGVGLLLCTFYFFLLLKTFTFYSLPSAPQPSPTLPLASQPLSITRNFRRLFTSHRTLYGASTYLGWRVIGGSYGKSLLANLAESHFLSDSSYTHLVLSFTETFHGLCKISHFPTFHFPIGTPYDPSTYLG